MDLKKSLVFIYTLLIIVLTWPLFAAWIPTLAKPWWLYPICILIGAFSSYEYFSTKHFKWLFAYFLVILLNSLSGDKYIYDPISAITRSLALVVITSAPFIFFKHEYEKSAKFLFNTFLILILFTSIATYYYNIQFPEVVRNDITITGANEVYEYSYLYRFGLTRYQFAHAMPILIPPFVMAYKGRGIKLYKKLFFASIVLLCIIHTFASGSTTAFLLSIIATLMSISVKVGSTKINIQRIAFLSFFLLPLLSNEVLYNLLEGIDYLIGGEGVIHEHIFDLQSSLLIEGSTGDLSSRQNLYGVSLSSFISNPFLGTNDEMGNHSVFLDHLGAFGIIGFVPFFALLWSEYKYVENKIGKEYKFYYMICMICAFGMLASKNASIWSNCCFLYIAAPIFFIRLSKAKK